MMRSWIVGVLVLVSLGSLEAEERALVQRGGIDGKEFSEVGRLYVDDDKLIHFRSDQRLYYFSHMYYIWDKLAESGVVRDGKVTSDKLLRITGNYSKAAYVYNFLEEPALRGSQIVWIDRIEKVELPAEQQKATASLFDGESLEGWSMIPVAAADRRAWIVKDTVISGSASSKGVAEKLVSRSSFTDFELSFECRSSWGNSASLLLRANENGEGIALSLDHLDDGTIGFPKSAAGASRPYMLYQLREKRGVGAKTHFHIHYDGRFNYDAVTRDKLLECSKLNEFLREWDGGFWNVVRVRCVGADPKITVWINGFLVSKFDARTVVMDEKNPAHVGAVENYAVHPSGRIGFAIHSAQHEEPEFLLRELRIMNLAAQ